MADNSCAKCGACTSVCPVYQVTGQESLTARGRLHLLEKIADDNHSQAYLDIFSKCLLCDACHQVCPRAINLPTKVVESRLNFPKLTGHGSFAQSLVKGCLSHQGILAGIGKFLKISEPLLDKLPAKSGLRLKLGMPPSKHAPRIQQEKIIPKQSSLGGSTESVMFPGCLARHLNPNITFAATALISSLKDHSPPDIPPGQACCGLAFYSSGNLEEARQLARLNITAFAYTDAEIIVLCGSCYSHLASYPDLLADDSNWYPRAIAFVERLQESSSLLADQSPLPTVPICAPDRPAKKRVVYHDPCHLRYKPGLKKAPRQLLNSLPWVELVELPNGPQCCGSGGLFNLAHPDLAKQITGKLITDILAVDPDLVVTTCSGCLIQLHQQLTATGSQAKVRHLNEVLTDSAD
ncbi:MAG: (Fe-S)-binding protein [Desulfobulbaceae bacterium]|nr:(Fe-S)-binding protein [Desulfobulbaceae bacterium]